MKDLHELGFSSRACTMWDPNLPLNYDAWAVNGGTVTGKPNVHPETVTDLLN